MYRQVYKRRKRTRGMKGVRNRRGGARDEENGRSGGGRAVRGRRRSVAIVEGDEVAGVLRGGGAS